MSANEEMLEMFGYENESDLIGQSVAVLMDPAVARLHDHFMDKYRETGERSLVGSKRVVYAMHKDGQLFKTLIQLGEIIDIVNSIVTTRLVAIFSPPADDDHKKYNENDPKIIKSNEEIQWSDDEEAEEEIKLPNSQPLLLPKKVPIRRKSFIRTKLDPNSTPDVRDSLFVTKVTLDDKKILLVIFFSFFPILFCVGKACAATVVPVLFLCDAQMSFLSFSAAFLIFQSVLLFE